MFCIEFIAQHWYSFISTLNHWYYNSIIMHNDLVIRILTLQSPVNEATIFSINTFHSHTLLSIIVQSPVHIFELRSLIFFMHRNPASYCKNDFYWEFEQFLCMIHTYKIYQVNVISSLISLFNINLCTNVMYIV